jgi:outer membrane protein
VRTFGLFLAASGCLLAQFHNPYVAKPEPPVSFEDSSRLTSLLRAGNLYLSLPDALALALENNLDLVYERYAPQIAASDVLRTRGGGLPRGISLAVTEAPPGIGGPAAPLLEAAATGSIGSTAVSSGIDVLGAITPTVGGIAILGAADFSTGPPVPMFDPTAYGLLQFQRTTSPQSSADSSDPQSAIARTWSADAGVQQGFSTGTLLGVGVGASRQSVTPGGSSDTASLDLTFTQPLLRGFGVELNRRFIRIAKNNQATSDLVFHQQAISTVSGVIRLYYDLVSLREDIKVKEETLALAQQLYDNNHVSVEQGTLAPVELTRAQAQVAAARQDLANSRGFERQQELILKTYLTRRGTANPVVRDAPLILTTAIDVPEREPVHPIQDLLSTAFRSRPELRAARLQIENSNISLTGSRNELLPELDIVAAAQNANIAGRVPVATTTGSSPGTIAGGSNTFGTGFSQIFSARIPTYTVGVQLTLPIRNRVAQADVARDEIQLRQWQVLNQQLENQIRLEVENAAIALEQARAALDAAVETRILQEQSLKIETERFISGISTTFLVLQYQSFVAQARSTEVAARGTYAKARASVERAVGQILENHNISVDETYRGHISSPIR